MSPLDRLDDLATTPPPPLPEGMRLTSCLHLATNVDEQIRFADSKAAFLATIHTLLVGPLVYNLPTLRQAMHQ